MSGETDKSAEIFKDKFREERPLDAKGAKRSFQMSRWIAYEASFLLVFSFCELVLAIVYAMRFHPICFLFFSLAVLAVVAAPLLLVFLRKKERKLRAARYEPEGFSYLREQSDRYMKRLLNAIAFTFAAVTAFELFELSFYFFGHSKVAELAESILKNLLTVILPFFFLIKNAICLKILQGRIGRPPRKECKTHLLGITLFSLFYWVIAGLFSVFFRGKTTSSASVFLIITAIFFALILIYDLTIRKRVVWQNLVFNPRRVAIVTLLVFSVWGFWTMNRDTWYTQSYINSVPYIPCARSRIDYDEGKGVYRITVAEEDFKILHLTDIHLGGSLFSLRKDLLALQACYAEIEHARPDLVIVTGDLCFPMGITSLSFNNSAPVQQFAAFMRNVGIPWAFTYGNHDTESFASMRKEELDEVCKTLSYKTSRNLLYPYIQPKITGRNNQLIEIRNRDGSLNTALFLLDSNAYTGEGLNAYDYIHDDQVDWYAAEVRRLQEEEGRQIASLAFFHIPLQEYRTAYELYLAGSEEVTYHFGENNEKLIDKICCSAHASKIFDSMVALGSTTGTFCGHDHYNNLSVTYRGIRLTYGMSIDYLVMPGIEKDTAQRGAELITLHEDSSWDLVQIPLLSIQK